MRGRSWCEELQNEKRIKSLKRISIVWHTPYGSMHHARYDNSIHLYSLFKSHLFYLFCSESSQFTVRYLRMVNGFELRMVSKISKQCERNHSEIRSRTEMRTTLARWVMLMVIWIKMRGASTRLVYTKPLPLWSKKRTHGVWCFVLCSPNVHNIYILFSNYDIVVNIIIIIKCNSRGYATVSVSSDALVSSSHCVYAVHGTAANLFASAMFRCCHLIFPNERKSNR